MPSIPDPPWKRAQVGRRARKSEEQGAAISGGRRVPGSGSGRAKGDIKTILWLISDKFTDAKSFRITGDDLDKMVADAIREHRLPQMRITLPHYKLRVFREEDALYLEALAARHADSD